MSGGFPRWLRNLLWSDRDNELDAFGGVNFSVDKDWIAGIQYVAFISPPGNFKTEHNLEFSMRYDDNLRWMSPISLNPYAKLFFTFSGNSTVVLGKVPSSMSSWAQCRLGTSIPTKFPSSLPCRPG